jgi:DNA (cytosine-5)-methyltransferase 1
MFSAVSYQQVLTMSGILQVGDANDILSSIVQGRRKWKNQELPQPGEIDMICGGPPCQGFSGLNRFKDRKAASFNNCLIVTFLSYVEHFKPKFVLMENVRNLVNAIDGKVARLILRGLLELGYQCSMGLFQAGQYGVPQSRRRVLILATPSDQQLPEFSKPIHSFWPSSTNNLKVNGLKFSSHQWVAVGELSVLCI